MYLQILKIKPSITFKYNTVHFVSLINAPFYDLSILPFRILKNEGFGDILIAIPIGKLVRDGFPIELAIREKNCSIYAEHSVLSIWDSSDW